VGVIIYLWVMFDLYLSRAKTLSGVTQINLNCILDASQVYV